MLQILKDTFFFKYYLLVGMLIIFLPLETQAFPSNKIVKTSFHRTSQKETIEIQTTKKPNFIIFKLDSPKRVVFTIKNSYFPNVHQTKKILGKKANRIRISQNTKTQTRVVIDLIEDTDYQATVVALKNSGYLLRIDFPIATTSLAQTIPNTIRPILIAPLESSQLQLAFPLSRSPKDESVLLPDNHQIVKNQIINPNNQTIVMLDNSSLEDSIFDKEEEIKEKKDLYISGSILLRPSIDIDHDKTNENKTTFKNRTIIKIDYKNKYILSGISEYLFFGNQNETDDYNLDFYEVYYKHNTSQFDISIGKQIKRWGKTDQISPIDTLNPENLTEFIIPSYDERKIPVWMADFVFKKNDFFIEGVIIPFFEPSKFKYFGTDWAIFSHLKNDINDSSLSSSQKTYFNDISVNETKPDDRFSNFEYALRIGGMIQQLDFGFTYHYSFEDLPCFQSFPVKNLSLENPNSAQDLISNLGSLTLTNEKIETKYLRTQIFGFEFETTLSDLGIRGEVAWKDNESFLTRSFTSVRSPTLFWIIGADYTNSTLWYFNLQFGHQHISNYDSAILFFDKDNYSVIGEINKDLFFDWLNASFQYTIMLSDGSYYLSPRLVYTYIKNLEMTFGINLFEGSDNSIFGRYDKNDQIFLDLKYHF
ncbi:MAG: AMIN domain-containing protein [Proteobacteria bacterium]|nr:AMIN domain-containing protein [Pseudomonadota bacterium]MBU1583270.1 AMIN domain-containing protein [Pseudomonadota bacterium]MBU2632075.1 AMIN domain-containing protein [Pseudomonadota bacterium]